MANFNAPPKLLGVDIQSEHSSAQHPLGTRVWDELGNGYVYVGPAASAVVAKEPVEITAIFGVDESGNAGRVDGVSHIAITSAYYAFVQVSGDLTGVAAATDLDAGNLFSWVADSDGHLQEMVTVDEAGSATHVAGILAPRGMSLATEAANAVKVRLFLAY